MQAVKIQKTQRGQLYVHIPKFIERHFGLKAGQVVLVDIDGDKIVIKSSNSKSNRTPWEL